MMIDLDELSAHLQVQTNLLNEEKVKQEIYQRGIKAMADASNKESM